MPRPHPPEFRQRAIQLARERAKSIATIAADLGISESCLRGWLHQADIDDGHAERVFGWGTCRRKTASSWRNTSSLRSFERDDRQVSSRRRSTWRSENVMRRTVTGPVLFAR